MLYTQQCDYLFVDVFASETQLLIQYLIGCRMTETLQSEHLSMLPYQSLQGYWQSCRQTKYRNICGDYLFLIFFSLIAE